MKNTILYIGGAGFIGSRVVKLLKKQKKTRVVVLDNFSSGNLNNIPKTVDTVVGDVRSQSAVSSTINTFNPTTIVVGFSPNWLVEDKSKIYDAYERNIIGMVNISENLHLAKQKPKRLVFLSSTSIYKPGENIIEPGEINYLNPVAHSFKIAEELLSVNCNVNNISFVSLRIPEVYGGTELINKDLISFFINGFLNKEKFIVYGNKNTVRDFVFVDELAQNLLKIIVNSDIKGILNVGGQAITLALLIQEIAKKLGATDELAYFSKSYGFSYETLYADYSLLKSKDIKFEVKVRDVIDYIISKIKKNREIQRKKIGLY